MTTNRRTHWVFAPFVQGYQHLTAWVQQLKQTLSATAAWCIEQSQKASRWFFSTPVGQYCIRFNAWFHKNITPILASLWKHILKPIVDFGEAYKSTLTVMILLTSILTSVAVPPAALIGLPIAVGIIAAFFERRHNNTLKARTKEQTEELNTLKDEVHTLQMQIVTINTILQKPQAPLQLSDKTAQRRQSSSLPTSPVLGESSNKRARPQSALF